MRFIKSIGISLIGIVIVMMGLVYDILLAGIPYPDPTPELQARYDFHSFVAGIFYKTGGIVFLVGLLAIPFIWKMAQKKQANKLLQRTLVPRAAELGVSYQHHVEVIIDISLK